VTVDGTRLLVAGLHKVNRETLLFEYIFETVDSHPAAITTPARLDQPAEITAPEFAAVIKSTRVIVRMDSQDSRYIDAILLNRGHPNTCFVRYSDSSGIEEVNLANGARTLGLDSMGSNLR
jgi:hypothetical protein